MTEQQQRDLQTSLTVGALAAFLGTSPTPAPSVVVQLTRRASSSMAVFGLSLLWVLLASPARLPPFAASESILTLACVSWPLSFIGLDSAFWADPLLGVVLSLAPLLTTKWC